MRACGLCSQSYCAACVAEDTSTCATCSSLVPVPETHGDVTRLSATGGAPKAVRWLRGENGRYIVILGKGSFFQHLFVLDRDGRVVHRRKGVRLSAG